MTNIAYKTSKGNPNLPDGFITDHFETDQAAGTITDGYYSVVDQVTFTRLFENNVSLYRAFESAKGVVTADPNTPPPTPRPASDAQPVDPSFAAQRKEQVAQSQADADLFKQFLAWKTQQGNGSS